jgi:hypothetical protein
VKPTDNQITTRHAVLLSAICLVISVSRLFCLMHRCRFIVKPTDSQITMRQAVLLSAICLVISVSRPSDRFLFDAQVFIVKPTDSQITTRHAVLLSAICLVISVSRLFCLMHRYRFIVKPTDSQITTRQAVLLSAICLVISVSLSSPLFYYTTLEIKQNLFTDRSNCCHIVFNERTAS